MKEIKDCLTIKNYTDKAELYFYGDIVSDSFEKWSDLDTCPQDVLDYLNTIEDGKPIDIYINSGGGAVFAGISIYNALKRKQGKKTCYIDGLAGSIASVIAMAGDEIVMPSNSYLFIHKPLCACVGNANDMMETAYTLDRIEEGILNVYKEKLRDGVSIETIKEMLDKETWLVGEEASQYFNIKVVKANNAVAKIDINSIKNYSNIPTELLDHQPIEEPIVDDEEIDRINKEIELLKAEVDLLLN